MGDIARALGRVMRHHGRSPISAEQTRELIGKGPKTLIERAWMASGRPADEKQAVEITIGLVGRDWEGLWDSGT